MPSSKKAKTGDASGSNTNLVASTRKVLRAKRGLLQNLPELPLDILLEILQHLSPRDLLQLSRTSKAFRKFLLNRQISGLLWKTTLQNAGDPPERLPFLSELAWINLLFSFHCHSCMRNNVKGILWEFGVRYCAPCKSKLTGKSNEICATYQFPTELDTFRSDCPKWFSECEEYVHIPELEEFIALWEKTPWSDRTKLVQDRAARAHLIAEQAHKCRVWMRTQRSGKTKSRSEELEGIKQARISDIRRKLEEIGWQEEFDELSSEDMAAFKRLPEVRQPKKLTDRAWQSICSNVIAFMERTKAARLEAERIDIMATRIKELLECVSMSCRSPSSPRWQRHDPGFPDIAMFPEIRAIVELPNEAHVTRKTFQPVINALPSLIARWHEQMRERVGRELRKSYEAVSQGQSNDPGIGLDLEGVANSDLVDLAIFVFKYQLNSGDPLTYSSLIGSSCARHLPIKYPMRIPDEITDPYLRAVLSVTYIHPWSLKNIRLYTSDLIVARLRRLTTLCGLDWKTVTQKEMDERTERFICTCHLCTMYPDKAVMGWRRAMVFDSMTMEFDPGVQPHDHLAIKVADVNLAAVANAKEQTFTEKSLQEELRAESWLCARCVKFVIWPFEGDSRDSVMQHLIDVHGLDREEIQEEDLYFDSRRKKLLPLVMVKEGELAKHIKRYRL